MVKNYSYVIASDRGYAPHATQSLCILCGCKTKTIEKWAQVGSWIIGTGGVNTKRHKALLCAMRVDEAISFAEFKRKYPQQEKSLSCEVGDPRQNDSRLLLSHHFYYFGDQAPSFPPALAHIVSGRGCRLVKDDDIQFLRKYVLSDYALGRHGNPCNSASCVSGRKKTRAVCLPC